MPNAAITGAGTGLGRALAIEYAAKGYKLFLLGRTDTKLQIVKEKIMQAGGQAEVILCDVREQASVSVAFQQIGRLDLFINNAGTGIFGPLNNYTLEEIENILDTNVKGTIFTVQSAAPLIKESKGRILTVISTAGLRGKKNESLYCASKFAIRGFTESLQKEWEHEEHTITSVYMGGMNTPFWKDSTHVRDASGLQSPQSVAKKIIEQDDGRKEIIIDK
ncbi:SDR family oxidoreductase [Virgibacillus halodenitrificans]|uniref:SDR family NAD(P)-dependent oxidoreductase n=1 Tax=Virgibacillus halodenitrificans TaxID=1482 RepID=UPI001F225C4E|nr:SDR family oxidoreductase [Virgibacillus halodenitrificans]MCG1028080.1 SDR family oxidoreductase [Virgibacillus halodenitrificans]WHX24948.1 SDR family oxidoreductase [Virgibacillus halodenitrificans]